MKNAGIDMWIVAVKENHYDPLWEDLGRGYVTGLGYYVFFTARRARGAGALGPSGYLLNDPAPTTSIGSADDLAEVVRERDPKRIGVNMSDEIGPADGLSVTMHAQLVKTLGEPYASRLVSAEKLVSEFRSRRVAAEIVAFGEAAGIAIQLAERALSNEVITPGRPRSKTPRGGCRTACSNAGSAPSSTCPRSTSPAPRALSPRRTTASCSPAMSS